MRLLIGVAALGLAAVLFTGCTTVTTVTPGPGGASVTNQVQHFDPVKVVKVMHQVVPPAVRYANATTPQYRTYIVDAQVAACLLVGSTNVTPANIAAVFAQTGINSIQTPEIEGVTASVYGIYSAFYDDLIAAHLPQTEVVADMTIVLQGICDSLTEGLTPPVASKTTP